MLQKKLSDSGIFNALRAHRMILSSTAYGQLGFVEKFSLTNHMDLRKDVAVVTHGLAKHFTHLFVVVSVATTAHIGNHQRHFLALATLGISMGRPEQGLELLKDQGLSCFLPSGASIGASRTSALRLGMARLMIVIFAT